LLLHFPDGTSTFQTIISTNNKYVFLKKQCSILDFQGIITETTFAYSIDTRSRFPVISVHCLFKNDKADVKLILFS